jgi:hypothetical protein
VLNKSYYIKTHLCPSSSANGKDVFTDNADGAVDGMYGAMDHATDATDSRTNAANHVINVRTMMLIVPTTREMVMLMSPPTGLTYGMPMGNLGIVAIVSMEGVPLIFDVAYISRYFVEHTLDICCELTSDML